MTTPMYLSAAKTAALLGRSSSWFRRNLPKLEKAGFPKRDDLVGGWNVHAVMAWVSNRAGLGRPPEKDDSELIRRAKNWHEWKKQFPTKRKKPGPKPKTKTKAGKKK